MEYTRPGRSGLSRKAIMEQLDASSMWTWQFSKLQHAADLHGWTRVVSMQNQYGLMQREEEREMFGLLADQGVGSIPWSPLAEGRLARRPDGPRRPGLGAPEPRGRRTHRRPTKQHHLPDAVAALDVRLTDEEVYTPREPTGF